MPGFAQRSRSARGGLTTSRLIALHRQDQGRRAATTLIAAAAASDCMCGECAAVDGRRSMPPKGGQLTTTTAMEQLVNQLTSPLTIDHRDFDA